MYSLVYSILYHFSIFWALSLASMLPVCRPSFHSVLDALMRPSFLHLYIHPFIRHSIYCVKGGSDRLMRQPLFSNPSVSHWFFFTLSFIIFCYLRSPGCGSRPPVRRRGCRGATGWQTAWWSGLSTSEARPALHRSLAAAGTSAWRRRWRQRLWKAWQRRPACLDPHGTAVPCCCGRWQRWTTPPVTHWQNQTE